MLYFNLAIARRNKNRIDTLTSLKYLERIALRAFRWVTLIWNVVEVQLSHSYLTSQILLGV
jgi:hypothetical protein